MKMNRREGPSIQEIDQLVFPNIRTYVLDNGVPVTEVNMGTQEITKMDIVFYAGRIMEDHKLVSRGTSSLIKEGTSSLSSAAIAEKIDFYGASMITGASLDTAHISVFCLSKYVSDVFPVVSEVLSDPIFPEEELRKYISANKQKLSYDLSKNDIISYRKITEEIFGSEHPYGYNSTPEMYDTLTREMLLDHHKKYFTSDNYQIFLSGHITEEMRTQVNKLFGYRGNKGFSKSYHPSSENLNHKTIKINDGNDQQSSIRIGRKLFNRKHEDFPGMFMLNTILGGYFGSRLMHSIREEKGYTYNVYSSLDPLINDGYFYIGTEVSNTFTSDTIDEVYKQIDILKNEDISDQELKMVRNYIMGNFLTMLDGPFNVAKVARTLKISGLELDFYDKMVQKIKSIDALELRTLANKYLHREDMIEVIVGRNL